MQRHSAKFPAILSFTQSASTPNLVLTCHKKLLLLCVVCCCFLCFREFQLLCSAALLSELGDVKTNVAKMAEYFDSRLPSVMNIRDLKPGAKNLHLVFIVLDIGR